MSLLTRDFLAPFRRRMAPEARSPLADPPAPRARVRGRGRDLNNRLAERLSRRRALPFGNAESLERRLALAVDVGQITGNGFFFVDTGQGRVLDSEYSGYSITNNDPVTYADVWVQAHDFTGGVLNLSPNEDGVYHLGQLDPGEVDRAWFYLTATGSTVLPQSHVISVYNGDPREGGTLIPGATQSFTFTRVEQTIEASANKVFTVSYDTLTPVLGGTLAMTVTGDLGQAGGDSVLFTPDTFNTWQPGVFELETMTIEITGTNARTVTDELFLTGFASAASNLYTAVYTFRVVDVIATETPVSPTQFVGRDLQWKHDKPIGVAFPPVPAVTNPLLLEKLVAPAGSMDPPAPAITIPDTGETVEFSLTFSNSSMLPAALDSIRDTLPPGAVYVPGSATYGGLPIGDPTIVGSELTWLGPFAVLPLGSATLAFDAVMPAITGVYVNSSVGRIGSVQIDTTLNTKDDVPATATVTVAKFADLAITKTDGQATDIPGTSLVYTITVTNNGPSNVAGVPVTDNFPASLEDVSWTVAYSGGASGPMMGTGNIDVLLGMPAGSSATFTVTTTIDEAATGTLLNTAAVGVPAGVFDPDPANNTSTDTTLLVPTGDLSITKTDGQLTDVPGTLLTYTILVANLGPSAVSGALVNDAFPPELTDIAWNVSYVGGSGPMMGSGPLVNVPVNLAAGGTATFTVTSLIAGTARGTLSNTATVAAPPGFTDPNLANNSATDTTILLPEADLVVVKARTSGDPVAGAAVEYLITVTNDGPSTILGFTLLDTTAPSLIGATFGTPSMGSYNPATGAWTGLMLATGQSVTITLAGTVPGEARGELVNTADALPPAGVTDPDLDNNTSIVTDVLALVADLAVTKVRTSAAPVAGLPVTYEIQVTNNGPTTVMGFTLTDTTAPGLIGATFGTPSVGLYDPATGLWTGLMLATGQSVTITLTGTVPPASVGLLENTADVVPPDDVTDPNLLNNTATVTDVITGEADLAVVKTRTSGDPVAGASVTYEIEVTNNGPSTILGFTLTDTTAPALIGATFGTPSMGSYNPATGAWTGLMLATGESVTITLAGTVPGEARGELVNTATVSPPPDVTDPDPSDDTSTVTDVIALVADLNVVKIRTSSQPVAGEEVTYQITVTNQGPTTIDSFTGVDLTTPALESPSYTVDVGTYDPGTGIWTGPALATGATVVFTLTGTVPAGATGSLVNTATVSPPPGVTDPDPSDDSSTVTDEIDLVADLAVVKTRTSGDPVAGAAVEYLITVTNDGPSTILGFTLLDTTAPALIGATFGTPSMGSYNPATGAWTGLMLATGQSVTITLAGTVPGEARGELVNTATVSPPPDVTDPDPSDDTSTVTDVIALVADLNVVKIRTSSQPVAGEEVTYQITVTNQGPTTIDSFKGLDVSVPDLLSPTYTVSTGTYDPAAAIWTGPPLATGGTVVFTLSGTVPPEVSGLLINVVVVDPPDGVIDPDPADNRSEVIDEIDLVADLGVIKTRTSGQPVAGLPVTYEIVVTNFGPSALTSFTGTDMSTPMLEGLVFAVSTGSYNPDTGLWTADPGDWFTTGETVTFTLTGTLSAAATGLLVNTATGQPPAGVTDPNQANNTSTVTDEIVGEIDLTATKTGDETYKGGGFVNFTVVVTNQGPSFASGVRVTDALPTGVVNWSWTVSYTGDGSGTADGSPDSVMDSTDPIDKLIDLAVLGTATFTITALTDAAFQSDITNTVVATLGQESATASWASAYDGPINPTQDVGALVVSNDDLCFGLPFVRVLDPETGAIVSQFLAYEPSFRGSVRVATGDLTGDGVAEIIVAPGRNRIGQIRVFTPEGVELTQYRTFAFGPRYRGGVNVAVGDINGDGINEIIASRSSGLSRVNVFGVNPLAVDPVTNVPIRTFIGIPGAYRNGVVVTAGDYGTFVNGVQVSADPDGIDEIAVGTNAGIRAWVRVFDAASTPRLIRGFFAIGPQFRGGVTLSSARWDGDGVDDIIVGAGVGGRSIVEVYGGGSFSQLARLTAFSTFARPNAAVNAAAVDIDGDGIADSLYGVQGRGGNGGSRGVRRYDRISTDTATLPASTVLLPPLRIAPITLRILGG